MPLRLREARGISIIDIDGNIDINSSDIVEAVGSLLSSGKINILLNFENVGLVDYSGLSILAISYKNVVNHKGKIKFLNIPLSVLELLKIVKLESVFENYTDEDSALESFYNDSFTQLHLRRKFKRLDIHLKVQYSIVGGQKAPKVFEGAALNISAAGIYIYTPYTLPMNSVLELKLILPDTAGELTASGRVVYIADKDIQPHSYPGMGVAFAHLTPEKEKAIINFIEKNIVFRVEP